MSWGWLLVVASMAAPVAGFAPPLPACGSAAAPGAAEALLVYGGWSDEMAKNFWTISLFNSTAREFASHGVVSHFYSPGSLEATAVGTRRGLLLTGGLMSGFSSGPDANATLLSATLSRNCSQDPGRYDPCNYWENAAYGA